MGKTVALYELELGTLRMTVEGISPLICHRFSERAMEQIENKQQGGAIQGKAPRNPQAEMLDACYLLPDGQFGFPAIAFKKGIVRAAKAAGIAMTDARGAFQINGDLLPLRAQAPTLRSDRVFIGKGETSIAYRLEFMAQIIEAARKELIGWRRRYGQYKELEREVQTVQIAIEALSQPTEAIAITV